MKKTPSETSMDRYDWTRATRGRFATRFPRSAVAHEEPSKASLEEIPEREPRAKLLRRGPRPGRTPRTPTLRGLRVAHGLTQAQVAKASGISQPEISNLESARTLDDRMIATLRRYLGALGEELELVSVSQFGHRMALVGDQAPEPEPRKKRSPAGVRSTR